MHQENHEPDKNSRDAVVRVNLRMANMEADIQVEPPVGAGSHVTRSMLNAALEKAGVVYGIDDEAVSFLLQPLYGDRVVVARGTPAQDGKDGECKELFSREKIPSYAERPDGTVDYKELNLINDVPESTVVCEIIPPTEPVDGCNVLGQPVKGRSGKRPTIPVGEGTRLSADGSRVETTVPGNLVFRGGRFVVDKIYRVENIDYDVGNITFSGDVIVNGDMLDGFEIHAGGDITLRGRVGSVVVVSKKGNVKIDQGINGMGKAVVEAAKEVRAGFIENCTVRAGEKVVAESIINSQIECEGDVDVTRGRGLVCGGKITAFGSIKANEVGNESNTLTIVVLGVTPRLLKERVRLTEQLADITRNIDEMAKNMAYIERLVADGRPVPPERVSILQRTKITMPLSEKKQMQLQNSLVELETKLSSVVNSTLTARILHPPTKISIGALSTNCIETKSMCRVFRNSDGELVFGTY